MATKRSTSHSSSSSSSTSKKRSTSTRRKTSAAHKKASSHKSTGEGQACWPGFKRVAGTKAGTKGSCEPKAHQTKSEKKADSRAAAASKREKTGRD